MLDDLQVLYYDCNVKKVISRSQLSSTNVVEDFILEGANIAMEYVYYTMRNPAHRVNLLSNHTGGVHVHQMLGGCVLDNDKSSLLMVWEAYDGTEVAHYDMHNRTVNPLWPQLMWTTKKEASYLMDFTNVYRPICIQTLKYYLGKEKNIVLRKERPRVRLIHKLCIKTGEMKVSCLATGFYPRHINLTMLRDGHPIPDEELILGEVLPNGDGTYQTRRTLSICSEELRERHHYTCSFTHLTLDNKLDINWVPEEGSDVAVISSLVVVLVLVLVFTIPVFVLCKRRHKVSSTSFLRVDSAS
ncbi:class I histocompatibility antigen, F10 alpha chain-like [Conger conger]|uniref:class I histocompatibility antigen, F10 alpha chain-like n=1 Tax=Conger conger TaxID=82655 RepID=UPI002A5AA276|nr:class I histocompatibility antigen, F10 alpha chain-like [Conger conger]